MITGAAATAIADFGASCMCRLRDRQTEMRILYYEAHWEFSGYQNDEFQKFHELRDLVKRTIA